MCDVHVGVVVYVVVVVCVLLLCLWWLLLSGSHFVVCFVAVVCPSWCTHVYPYVF